MNRTTHYFAPMLWIIFYLVVIDFAVNLIFSYPKDPRNITPSALQQYFEYGRSTEGKFARMTRATDEESAPIVSSGWLNSKKDHFLRKDQNREKKPIVTVYGMSHANLLADDMVQRDTGIVFRYLGAPGAVPSWSFTAYMLDNDCHSDVVILGVMTDGVPLVLTTSGATMFFDYGYPYTYPQYFLSNGELQHTPPPFMSVEGYREYLADRTKWNAYVDWLSVHDKFYDPLLFRETILDHSSLFRMLRRAYVNTTRRARQMEVYNATSGFNVHSEEVKVLQAIVVTFAESARRNKSFPIVYLVNNFNTGDHLFKALEPILSSNKIAFLSSHILCPPNNPRFYLPDSHFEPSKNMELAEAMLAIIHASLGK